MIPSRRRFEALLAFLKITDGDHEGPDDKLKKIRYLYEHIREACKSYYQPDQNLSVDERMVKCKGRFGFKQYIKNKPVRWGFKIFALCCSKTGYLWNFKVYTGRDQANQPQLGLTKTVVTDLCEPFFHQGYRVYFDQFYTSPVLATTLLSSDIHSVGTCQINRSGVPGLKNVKRWDKQANRGDIRYVRDNDLFTQWKDKRTVTILSTLHKGNDRVMTQCRTKQNGQYVVVQVPKPLAVEDYNHHMGGVEVFDQLVATYRILRKTRKWWKTLFFDLVDVAVVNSFLLYRSWGAQYAEFLQIPSNLSHLEFRECLIRDLVGIDEQEDVPVAAVGRRKRRHDDIEDGHPPEVAPSSQRRNCVVCYRMHHVERKTRFFCGSCKIDKRKAFLCLHGKRKCWSVYHSHAFDAHRE